jgi:simple sugar transport system permease protein
MMNYIAVGLVSVFLSATVTSGSGTLGDVSTGNLPVLVKAEYLTIIVIAILLFLIFVYLRFHKHGYELEVVGESQNTAKYVGINVKKVIIRTMALSGALCGLIGLLIAGSIDHTITADSAKNLGFTAIMVAWLAKFNPFVMVGTSFVITFLDNGMGQVQTTFGITNDSIADIVVGLVYFAIIAVEFFISYRIVFRKKTPKLDIPSTQNPIEVKEGK